MRKRIICLVLCAVLLCSSCCVTVFAVGNNADITTDLILFGFEMLYDWERDTNRDVKDMTGDQFYNWYNDNTNFDSALWRAIYKSIGLFGSGAPYGTPQFRPKSITSKGDDSIGLMQESHYNAAMLSKDIVDSLNAEGVDFASRNGERYYTLEDISLATTDSIRSDLIKYTGDVIANCGSTWNKQSVNQLKGYYTEYTTIAPTAICFYPGGSAPPMFYVPLDCVMYQAGVALPVDSFYVVLGDNLLLRVHNRISVTELYPYYWGGVDSSTVTFGFYHNGRRENMEIYSSGSVVGVSNSSSYPGWSCVDLFESMSGFIVNTPDYEITPPPSTFIPDNIPYDDDDNVIVLIPENGGDIIYMSPTDYDNYVNNGTIVEGDYINNFNDDIVHNIFNNYNNYITNYNSGSNDYDDSKVLNKLDTIIDKLDKIYNTIKSWKLPKLSKVEPEYDNFSDCIIDNVPIAKDINDLVEAMHTSEAKSGFEQENKSIAGSSSHQEKSIYDGLGVDVSWYEPYRNDIRDLLKLFCYALGIGGIWSAVRSVFGIHSSGGDDD